MIVDENSMIANRFELKSISKLYTSKLQKSCLHSQVVSSHKFCFEMIFFKGIDAWHCGSVIWCSSGSNQLFVSFIEFPDDYVWFYSENPTIIGQNQR